MRVKVKQKGQRDEKEEEVIDKGNEFHKQYKTAESTEVSALHSTKGILIVLLRKVWLACVDPH